MSAKEVWKSVFDMSSKGGLRAFFEGIDWAPAPNALSLISNSKLVASADGILLSRACAPKSGRDVFSFFEVSAKEGKKSEVGVWGAYKRSPKCIRTSRRLLVGALGF